MAADTFEQRTSKLVERICKPELNPTLPLYERVWKKGRETVYTRGLADDVEMQARVGNVVFAPIFVIGVLCAMFLGIPGIFVMMIGG